MRVRDELVLFRPGPFARCCQRIWLDIGGMVPCPFAPVAVIAGRTYCAQHGAPPFVRYLGQALEQALVDRFGPADPAVEGVPV
jgi:hypothetical protein